MVLHLVALLALVTVATARAHDPYEITTRAFIYSNHLELRIEMEFPAAMLLAGQGGWRTNHLPAADQLALAYPMLAARAAGFLQVMTNGVPLPVTSTNIALGIEEHVSFILWLPAPTTDEVGFAIGELRQLSEHGTYGTSLTVLDMVRQQVLGQTVLFGDSAPFSLNPVKPSGIAQASNPPGVIRLSTTNFTRVTRQTPPRSGAGGWLLLLLLAGGALLLFAGAARRLK